MNGILQAVPVTQVQFTDEFWAPRIEINRTSTLPQCFHQCEETGRIKNFEVAGRLAEGKFEGIYFNDSDVYKVVEGAAHILATQPDEQIEDYLDQLISKFAAAQQDDGYLNTYYTLVEPDQRWSNLPVMHELYCAGHLFEAAVAYFRSTGKRNLLDIAIKFADHIDGIFGEDKRIGVPGHQEIELALVKLYEVTGEKRYLNLAAFFIDQALNGEPITIYGDGSQTRSFCFYQDEVEGIYRLLMSNLNVPINIGNPNELTILELAETIIELTGSRSQIIFQELPEDDPKVRRPDISRAKRHLDWQPVVDLRQGLTQTIDYFATLSNEN